MRFKLLVFALVSALVMVSAAVAKDHPGKGSHPGKGPKPKTGQGCKPSVSVMLAGVLAADVDPQDGDTSFVLTVKRSNKHGRAYKQAGAATIAVDSKTRIRRQGAHNLGALAPNDRVHVTAKVCKADLKDSGTPDLTARKVGAHAAKAPKPESDS
jgi:hypothetical protein